MPAAGYIEILPSAARTTAQTGDDNRNTAGWRGIKVVFDVTAGTAGFSVTLTIQGKDRISGKYFTLLAGAAVGAAATNVYTVYPALTAATNVTASDVLPDTWRVIVAVADTKSVTYSVAASLQP